jgi:PIN domain nuclease of toxin-antitoxin system
MEHYFTDTHPLIWHLADAPALSAKARRCFKAAESGRAVIYLSVMSLIEVLYLTERGRIHSRFLDVFLHNFSDEEGESYQMVPVTKPLVLAIAKVPREIIPELPDRVIAATALSLGVPLITKDSQIRSWDGIEILW